MWASICERTVWGGVWANVIDCIDASNLFSIFDSAAATLSHCWLAITGRPHSSHQSGRSPKVVAPFSATNFNSYIIYLFQLQDAIQIQWNYAWIHYDIAKRSHLMI